MSAVSFSIPPSTVSSLWAALQDSLAPIASAHPDAVLASSLGAEDMLLTHAIFTAGLPRQVFTLDTGRLHEETLALIQNIQSRHGETERASGRKKRCK